MGLAAAAAVVMTTFAPRLAHACSRPSDCPSEPRAILIGDPARRPTNTCVVVDYGLLGLAFEAHREAIEGGLAYVAADGTRVALVPTEWHRYFCPSTELLPDTDYTLVGPAYAGCTVDGETSLASFHTASTPDVAAPSTPGPIDDVSCAVVRCDSSACCGPYTVTTYRSEWAASTDDLGAVAYVFGGEVRFGETHDWYAGGGGYGPMFGFAGAAQGLVPHAVRAIDGSGNTSAPAVEGRECVVVEDDAAVDPDAGPAIDAAIAPRGDAGAPDMDAGPASSGGGCSATHARSSSLATFVGAALVFALRRRARRARPIVISLGGRGPSPSRRRCSACGAARRSPGASCGPTRWPCSRPRRAASACPAAGGARR
jgi:hypothetical protein